jgi:hypothetical protein
LPFKLEELALPAEWHRASHPGRPSSNGAFLGLLNFYLLLSCVLIATAGPPVLKVSCLLEAEAESPGSFPVQHLPLV